MAKSRRANQQKHRVLVVDDVLDNRELYKEFLRFAGYVVDIASDGQEALDKIAKAKPSVVIMDISMPVMDGLEATRRIKKRGDTKDIYVIILSGYVAGGEQFRQAEETGADEVCMKPCLPKDLLAKIQRVLSV